MSLQRLQPSANKGRKLRKLVVSNTAEKPSLLMVSYLVVEPFKEFSKRTKEIVQGEYKEREDLSSSLQAMLFVKYQTFDDNEVELK